MELLLVESVDVDNPIEGDLKLETGTFVFTTDKPAEVAQRLRTRFRFFKGEWFLDRNLGTPWFQEILKKNPNMTTVRAIFSQVITNTPEVASLDSLEVTLDRQLRQLEMVFVARLTDGTVLRSTNFPPFLVEL